MNEGPDLIIDFSIEGWKPKVYCYSSDSVYSTHVIDDYHFVFYNRTGKVVLTLPPFNLNKKIVGYINE